jgi:hypothetical protein
MMRQKLEYIHNNPVKRGYVDDPKHWRYSSARNYAGTPGLIEVATMWYATRERDAGASQVVRSHAGAWERATRRASEENLAPRFGFGLVNKNCSQTSRPFFPPVAG